MRGRYLAAYAGLPRAVYVLFAARLVNSMGYFITPLLTLILTQKLGMGKAEAGAAAAFLILTQAPCVLLGGRLADTVGRKRTLLLGSLAAAACYLPCGFGLAGWGMVGCLILAADCAAVAAPAADALVADLTDPAERQAAYSLLYLGINIGMAVSPLAGGLLFRDHLPLLFVLDAATTLAAATIVARGVPETALRRDGRKREASRTSLAAALRQAPVLAGFLALLFLYDFCYSQWNFLLPAQLGERFALDGARRYSLLTSVNAVTVLAMTPLLTRLTRRVPPLGTMALAGLLFAAAYVGFGAGGPYAVYVPLAVVFTLGEICSAIQIGAFLSNRAPGDCLGRVGAFSTLLRGGASALGPLLVGRLLTVRSDSSAWLAAAGITLCAAAGFAVLARWDRRASSAGER